MSDQRLREAERKYSEGGALEDLDALEVEWRRAGLGPHPDAEDLRLKALTRVALALGRRTLGALFAGGPKPMLRAQYALYLANRLDALQRKSQNGGRDISWVKVQNPHLIELLQRMTDVQLRSPYLVDAEAPVDVERLARMCGVPREVHAP